MQGITVNYVVVQIRLKLFTAGQAYVILSKIHSSDGNQKLVCFKLSGKTPRNNCVLSEMNGLSDIAEQGNTLNEKGNNQTLWTRIHANLLN